LAPAVIARTLAKEGYTMHRHLARTVVFAIIAAGFTAPAAAQDRACSNASLRGTWAYTETGSVIAPTSATTTVTILAAAVGTYTFDNDGNFTGTQYSSANGAISHDTKQGTYIVSPDCTGTLDLFVTNQFGVLARHSVWSFVIADREQELRSIMRSMEMLTTVPPTPLAPIMTMSARKLFPGRANGQDE
jgi:hypothetical protein